MAQGDRCRLTEIPFLDHAELGPDRFVPALLFHDGEGWRIWLQIEEPGYFIETKAWPAECCYFGRSAEQASDIGSAFLTFIGQRANFKEVMKPFAALQDDYFNLSASLKKLELLRAYHLREHGVSRLVQTEIEYVFVLCRSMFDLLQEIVAKLWDKITLLDGSVRKRQLKESFSNMVLSGNSMRTSDQLINAFGLPDQLARCYVRHAGLFEKVRLYRDKLVHRGSTVQTIFAGESDFLVDSRLGPFVGEGIWRDDESLPNGLAPLMPVLASVIRGTLIALEDFSMTLAASIMFPPPIAPGFSLYMRGYFTDTLVEHLADVAGRAAERDARQPPLKAEF